MYLLGISCFYHDAAAVLLKDGAVVAAAQEERFTRKKHDASFPKQAIRFVLQAGGIQSRELDYAVFYDKPFLKFERILLQVLQTYPRSFSLFKEFTLSWFREKLWIGNILQEFLNLPADKILFCEHHLSHAASAFLCSPFEESAILTVDGVGEWATTSFGVGQDDQVRILEEIHFPHSLGMFYSTFTAFLGFEVNEGEYKVMGLSSYGKPIYQDKVRKLITLCDDGGFRLNMDYFSFHHSLKRPFNRRFCRLFGEPRKPEIFYPTSGLLDPLDSWTVSDRYYADLAASAQSVLEETLLHLTRKLYEKTHLRHLCLAGGVALNSRANFRLLRETPFENIFIQPAAGDAGGALGAALTVHHTMLHHPRSALMNHVSWGASYSTERIQETLKMEGVAYELVENQEELLERCAALMAAGRVIGWFQGRFEWGPRSLGHRSILADPRRSEMKEIINRKIKFREPFRPFAPSVLADHASAYFELPENFMDHYPLRFMLYVVPVKGEKQSEIPAVTHVDGTARIHLVFRDIQPLYYRLIEKFYELTHVPMLLNTSFNLKGEPIVNTPQDALQTFFHSEMDELILENIMVSRKNRIY